MFSTLYGTYFSFQMHFKMLSAICFNLDRSKILSSGKWVKLPFSVDTLMRVLTHSHTMMPFDASGKRAISPFPTVFSTHLDDFLLFSSSLKLSSANSFSLEESKICHLVMG